MQIHTSNLMGVLCDPDRKHQNQMDESVLFNATPVLGVRMFVQHLLKKYCQGKTTVDPQGEKPVSVKGKDCRAATTSPIEI